MFLDELCTFADHHHHSDTFFAKSADTATQPSEPIGTATAMGIGASLASAVGIGAYMGYKTVAKWSLRDSSVQVPDFDPSTTPTGSRRGGTTPVMGETGDPSEFLSPTPGGKVRKNPRARFF